MADGESLLRAPARPPEHRESGRGRIQAVPGRTRAAQGGRVSDTSPRRPRRSPGRPAVQVFDSLQTAKDNSVVEPSFASQRVVRTRADDRVRNPDTVIPGWSAGPDPESRDSGFDAEPVIGPRLARTRWHRPGMTESGSLPLRHYVKLKSTYDFALATRSARGVDEASAHGGRGECRVPAAPAASCALCIRRTHTSNNEYTGTPDIPARNGFEGRVGVGRSER